MMRQPYCGKDCQSCEQFTGHCCPGCAEGPGRLLTLDCPIASCARRKSMEQCSACSVRNHCGSYMDRHKMPQIRKKKKLEEEQQGRSALQSFAALSVPYRVLLLLTIPNIIAAVLSTFKDFANVASYLQIGTMVVTAFTLLHMGKTFGHYHTASLLLFVRIAAMVLCSFLTQTPKLFALLTTAATVLTIFITRKTYEGHAAALLRTHKDLSKKWSDLWEIVSVVLIVSVAVPFIAGLLGSSFLDLVASILTIILVICLIVISVVEFYYLYLSAKAAKTCKEELNKENTQSAP